MDTHSTQLRDSLASSGKGGDGHTAGATDAIAPALVQAACTAEIRRGEDSAVYHANETHRSCSRVKTFLDGPTLYHKRYVAKTLPPFSSAAMDHGTLLHRWLEEGDTFLELLVAPPESTLTATGLVGKEAEKWAKNEAPAGSVVVGPKERAQILAEVEAIKSHPAARSLIERIAENEVSVYWQTDDGYRLKCRLDGLTSDGIVIDLKTTRDESIRSDWWGSMLKFRYHLQDAWYRRGMEAMGLEPKPLHFIVISTSISHDCEVVTLPPLVVAEGRRLMDKALADLRLREDLDWWLPDSHGEVIELPIPAHILGRL